MKEIQMPPSRACGLCRNRMNEVCLNGCTTSKDFKQFDPDMRYPLRLLPALSFKEFMELPGSMKGKWLFIQQTKIVEVLNESEPEVRPSYDRPRSCRLPSNFQVKAVLPGAEEKDTPHPTGSQCENLRERPGGMAEEK